MHVRFWIEAMRLRTLPLAIAHISMGNVLAAFHGVFSWEICWLTLSTAVLLQILSNLANDYGDAKHGADHSDRQGPARAVSSGMISAKDMKLALIVVAGFSLISGIALILISLEKTLPVLVFLALGLLSIWAAINYTAGDNPYGYKGLGDLAVFTFFGLLAVCGPYFLQTGSFQWSVLLPASSCGLLSIGVLNINNIRDIDSDAQAGKISVPVRLGRERAIQYHHTLLVLGICFAVAYTLLHYSSPWQFLFLTVLPILWINARAVKTITEPMRLDPYLKQLALANVLFVTTFALGLWAIP